MSLLERQALAVFEDAVELPAGERPDFLAAACQGQPELRREVERLLAADDSNNGFLAEPLVETADRGLPATAKPLEHIGDYEVLGKIGQGGTSSVYLARRHGDESGQKVAIKVLAMVADVSSSARSGEEARLLGELRHPAIARLFEVGQTPDGVAFLVMEHVSGLPIDQHCDRRALSIAERIDLFLAVCEGVAAAHRNLVVHRDLKPGNILVSQNGHPKLVDFGLARIIGPLGHADQTTAALRFLTLNYASPEHLTGGAFTTASDTYSLGVVLYQLLTGSRPYEWGGRPLLEVLVEIGRLEIEPPSRVVTDDPPGQRAALARGTTPTALRARLRGDLDRIVLRALSVDPSRRYESPGALAAELRRERDGLPILARPSSVGYRCERFLRRHRWAVAQAALVALVLIAAASFGLLQSKRLAVERDLARDAQARTGRVVDFLVDSWTQSDPMQGGHLDAAGLDRLVAAVGRLEEIDDPALRAELRHTLGKIFGHLGELDRGVDLLQLALVERQRLGSPEAVFETELELAWVLRQQGTFEQAEQLSRDVIERARSAPQWRSFAARGATTLGETLSLLGRHQEAEQQVREALAANRELRGESHEAVANDYNNLSMILYRAGQPAAAEQAAIRCLEIARRLPQVDPGEIANVLHNLGVIVMVQGKLAASEGYLREALTLREQAFGPNHPMVANSLNSLSLLAAERGNFDPAERDMRRALEINRQAVGPDHEWALANLANLVEILDLSGQVEAASGLATETIRRSREHLPADSPPLLYALTAVGSALLDDSQQAVAGELLTEAVERRRETLPAASPDRVWSELALARWQLATGAAALAETSLRSLLPVVDQAFGLNSWQSGWARCLLADALSAAGAWPEALATAREGHELLTNHLPPGHFRLDVATSVLGLARVATGDEAGRTMLAEAQASLERHRGAAALSTRQAGARERIVP